MPICFRLRLPSAKSLGDSVVLYSGGDITLSELTEELVESDLEKAIANGTPLTTIRDNLLHVQTQLRQYNPDIKLFPRKDKEKLTRQDIIEAYSTLQTIDLIHRADRLPLTDTARTIIKYTLGQTELARATRVLGDAWATYANSKDGQAYLTTTGKTLSDLLDTAGISQSRLYSDLRVEEQDRIAVETAQNFNPITALEQQQKELDRAAAEADHAATTNTQAGLPRTEIPAEESVTGQPIPVDPLETADNDPTTGEYNPPPLAETTTDPAFISPVTKSPFGITTGMMPPANLKPHPALRSFGAEHLGVDRTEPRSDEAGQPQNRTSSIDHRTSTYNPNAKPILALRMPDGSNLIVAGRTRHQIALADPTCKAVKTTLIDYDTLPFVNRNSSIVISENDWVQMTNAGEHIINRTATTEHYRTYFTHNPITHAQAIEQGLVPIDPKTGRPTAAYIKGRQEAEHILAAKAEADAAAEAAEAAEAKAEKQLPGQTKWATPSKKSKPLSDSETKQTLISVAGQTASKDKTRYVLGFVSTQRSKGTEYTVGTDGRRLTVISQSTYKEDTDTETHEFYDSKGVQYRKDRHSQAYPNWRQVVPDTNKQQASTTIDLSYYSFLAKGSVKSFDRDPQSPSKKDKEKRIATPLFQDGQNIVFNVDGHRASINPIYMRDLYKQMQELGKKLGFPPTLKVHYFDKDAPLVFTAEHNGITFQSIIMPLQDPIKNEQGYPQKDERGRWLYEPPAIKPGDIILGEQPSIYGEQDTGSFSLRTKQEMQSVHNCVEELASGAERGILHDTAWGKDIIVPRGRYGKKGFGVEHMREKRLLHGFTEDEAAFIIVCALKAAESTENPTKRGNKWLFDKFGIRAVVAEQKEQSNLMITGFVLGTEGKEEAVDSEAAQLAQHFYALDELSRIQQVGAALQKALSRFEKIVNNNPQTWEQVVTAIVTELQKKQNAKANGETYSGSPLDAFSQQETLVSSPEAHALFQDGVMQASNAIVTQPGATLSLRALHASSHNFRKFSTDFMGSGEGAQAFGWGLYFAESEVVNKQYFAQFSVRDTKFHALDSLLNKYRNASFDFYFTYVGGDIRHQTNSFKKAFYSFAENKGEIKHKLKQARLYIKREEQEYARKREDDDDEYGKDYTPEEPKKLRKR